jgi:putative methionine-R-sulfoxide reductase with GAF domain
MLSKGNTMILENRLKSSELHVSKSLSSEWVGFYRVNQKLVKILLGRAEEMAWSVELLPCKC